MFGSRGYGDMKAYLVSCFAWFFPQMDANGQRSTLTALITSPFALSQGEGKCAHCSQTALGSDHSNYRGDGFDPDQGWARIDVPNFANSAFCFAQRDALSVDGCLAVRVADTECNGHILAWSWKPASM